MDFGFTEQEEKMRQEVRQFVEREVTEEAIREAQVDLGLGPYGWELLRKIGAKGWLCPFLPKEYGGLGLSTRETLIIWEELSFCGAVTMGMPLGPLSLRPQAAALVAPILIACATDEQKKEYLPRIARGEIEFSEAYTEPGAGSDLTALKMTAKEEADGYVLNGQKTFCSYAHTTQYQLVLVRTDPSVPKHKGLSFFIVDQKTPGITIRPLWTMAGGRVNEMFYDDVHVPKESLVGEKNQGFYYLLHGFGFERMIVASNLQGFWRELVEYCKSARHNGKLLSENPIIRKRLAEIAIRLEIGRLFSYRMAWMLDKGLVMNYEASQSKLWQSELSQDAADLGYQILGLYGQLEPGSKDAPLGGKIEHFCLWSVIHPIFAGTSEIMKNTIAIRGLGLPR